MPSSCVRSPADAARSSQRMTTTTCCPRTSSTRCAAKRGTLTDPQAERPVFTAPAEAFHCEECGYDYGEVSVADAVDGIRELGRKYEAPLTRGLKGESLDELLRAHPLEGTWSALEYACHMRDVLSVQHHRVT